MASKRQTTRAKLARERLIQERRALMPEKKQATAAAGRDVETVAAIGSSETVGWEGRVSASPARLFADGNEVKE
jgi:hypothetical protein